MDKQKCYDKAKELGYSVFAINIGSKDCYTSPNAWTTYQKYGPISCNDTEHEVNEVYQIRAGNWQFRNTNLGIKFSAKLKFSNVSAFIYISGTCDVSSFVDIDNGVTCEDEIGPCTVLANNMKSKYGSCKAYCRAQRLGCLRAWEEKGDSCTIKSAEDCDHNFSYTSDALCQCTNGMIVWFLCVISVDKESYLIPT